MENTLERILEFMPDETFLKMDGHDDAVIGYCTETNRLIYSVKKVIDGLIAQGMDEDEAVEFYEYNIVRSIPYMGESAPILCDDYYFQ